MPKRQVNTVFLAISMVVAVFYLPGVIFFPFFSDYYTKYYAVDVNPYFSFIVVLPLFLISLYCMAMLVFYSPRVRIFKMSSMLMILIIGGLCFLFLLSGIEFSLFQSRAFRHESRLADASLLTRLLFMLQPIVFVYVAKSVVYVSTGRDLGKYNKLFLLMILITMVISLSSSSHMISAGLLICIIFFPDLLRKNITDIRLLDYLKYALGAMTIIGFALLGGLGSKLGYQFIFSYQGLDYIAGHIGYIIARVSSSLYSLAVVWEQGVFDAVRDGEVLQSFYTTISNRIALVFGIGSFDTQVIATVNKINYDLIFGEDGSRAGASPGPLSSVLYFPLFPLGFFVLPLIYVLIGRSFVNSVSSPSRVTVLGLAAAFYFVIYMFEAPLNIFYFVDPVFFGFIAIFLLNWFVPERMYGR